MDVPFLPDERDKPVYLVRIAAIRFMGVSGGIIEQLQCFDGIKVTEFHKAFGFAGTTGLV
ncbi:hypothetical protein JCM10512_3261 [Bacteroides reticulotermitis JCM 10512]|uniref:Uncharacterized protein n=1 Tax=Bacteroides reticulotermitis JCM 10512 TaxID=1445607 RepID=W4UUG1_9BACE|nr:hypothetical protein JCM10512_3261 [Bacteroides reticulotermitis JCM 10512]